MNCGHFGHNWTMVISTTVEVSYCPWWLKYYDFRNSWELWYLECHLARVWHGLESCCKQIYDDWESLPVQMAHLALLDCSRAGRLSLALCCYVAGNKKAATVSWSLSWWHSEALGCLGALWVHYMLVADLLATLSDTGVNDIWTPNAPNTLLMVSKRGFASCANAL